MCHMPFGFGPRGCIGMRLALLEAKIALIELLQRYTFIRAPETEVLWQAVATIMHNQSLTFMMQVPLQFGAGLTVRPKNGIYLKVISRS